MITKEKQKKYYKLKKTKGCKSYKFPIGQAVMKANPKKLGGRKGDRMTPDWLDGYVVVGLTDHQVVLRNTKTNKVLKSISLAHIKPFRVRGEEVAGSDEVAGNKEVEGVEYKAEGAEIANAGDKVAGVVEKVANVGEEVGGVEVANVGEEDTGVGEEVAGVGEEVAGVGEEVAGVEVANAGDVVGVVDKTNDEVNVVGNELASAASSNFADEVQHLEQLGIKGVPLRYPYLDFGPFKLTRRDVWSLIPPQEVPSGQYSKIKQKVPDLRQNNISTIGNTVLTVYPNLKIVDLRHNHSVCGRINLVGFTIISDCPILTTSLIPSLSPIQNTPQSSFSKAPPISIITSCLAPKSSFSKATILPILSHSSIKNISRLSTIPAPRSSTVKVLSTPLTLITRSSPAVSTPRFSIAKPLETPTTPVITSFYISLNLNSHYQDLQQINPQLRSFCNSFNTGNIYTL